MVLTLASDLPRQWGNRNSRGSNPKTNAGQYGTRKKEIVVETLLIVVLVVLLVALLVVAELHIRVQLAREASHRASKARAHALYKAAYTEMKELDGEVARCEAAEAAARAATVAARKAAWVAHKKVCGLEMEL